MTLNRREFARSVLGAAALLGSYPARAVVWANGPEKLAVVPIGLYQNRPVVQVALDGMGPLIFSIDTGDSAGLAIRADRAAALKLTEMGGHHVYGAGKNFVTATFACRKLVIGGLVEQLNVRLIGLDPDSTEFDGIIPSGLLLLDAPADLDYVRRQLRLYASGRPDRTGFTPMPFTPQVHNQIVVDSMLQDQPVRLLVDTAAPSAVALYPHAVRRLGLWSYQRSPTAEADVAAGRIAERLVKVALVKVGPFAFKDVPVALMNPEIRDVSEWDGLVGADLLHRFDLSFDNFDHRLWVRANPAFADPFHYNRGGFVARFYPERGETVVTAVTLGQAAAKAGLRVGDRLAGIDRLAALRDLQWRATGPAGDILPVPVQRGDKAEVLQVTLEDWL